MMTVKKTRRFEQMLSEKKSSFLKELFELLEFPTLSQDKKEAEKCVKWLVEKLKELRFKTKIIKIKNSNPFILAEAGEGKRTLLIYDHYDVMPPGDLSLWKFLPFKPTIRNGRIFARGVADNKGHLMLRIQAIRIVEEILGKLPIKVKFLIEGEEELGSPHISQLSTHYGFWWKNADLCLWESGDINEDGTPRIFLGMKGISYLLLSVKQGNKDIHSGFASLVDSPVWRLVLALATMRNTEGEVLIDELNRLVKKPSSVEKRMLRTLNWDLDGMLRALGRKKFLGGRRNEVEVLRRHFYGLTCNICGISAGSTNREELKTVLPCEAYAKIDFRLVDGVDSGLVKNYVRKHLKKNGFSDIRVKELASLPVAKTDFQNKVFQIALKIIEKSFGKKPMIIPYAKGSGPMYYIASRFKIPCIQLGAQTLDSAIHGPNENISVDNYFKALRATIDLILNLS